MPSYVAYVSSATQLMSTDELEDLLITCRRNNEVRGVTGALLYQDGNFIQVLEGEQVAVDDLYEVISSDPRHHNVIALVRGTTAERQFAQWSMAFSDLSGSDSALGTQSRSFLHDEDDGLGGGSIGVGRRLLLSFRRTLDGRQH